VATAGGARGGAGRPLRVVYQDACHLAHGQRVRREPRDLLRAVEGIEVVPIADPERCCGSAGVYNLTHPEVARELQQRKVRAILAARPDVVVSANPGCILQIRAGLDEAGARLPVVHLMRFIDDPAASPVRSRPSRHPPVPSATGSAGRAKIGPPMSVSRSTYRHRLSSEDVRKSRILITKDAWKLFPEPGERVALRIGARSFDAEIKAERCECVPPAHEHYHLTCAALKGQAGFKSGALVVIAKDSVGGYRFVEERG
ncbi:MAG: (Fe-S)-binding protein, partial [Chloroflexi bacterium]|nr:(Fe-S)-binding protein [Chloroflexota bacterium]